MLLSLSLLLKPNDDTVTVEEVQPHLLFPRARVTGSKLGKCLKDSDRHVRSFHQRILLLSLKAINASSRHPDLSSG